MTKANWVSSERERKRLTRRGFLKGAAVGGAGMWAASVLPRRAFMDDPNRPPQLYEYFLDNFWFESAGLDDEQINPPLKGRQLADIAIVGGGFAGMSAAYNLQRRFPGKRIVLLEGACCGYGASGRNGGFADVGMPGLGFVYENQGPEAARAYYDATILGMDQIQTFVGAHGVDCDFEMNGALMLATEERHLEELAEDEAALRQHGHRGRAAGRGGGAPAGQLGAIHRGHPRTTPGDPQPRQAGARHQARHRVDGGRRLRALEGDARRTWNAHPDRHRVRRAARRPGRDRAQRIRPAARLLPQPPDPPLQLRGGHRAPE